MTDATVALPPPPAKGLKRSSIEFAAVILIGAVIGWAFEFLSPGTADKAKPEAQASTTAPSEASTIYDLQPIVTNLGAPQDTWIRLEGSIVFDPKVLPHPEAEGARISEDILVFLRTVSLKQLEGPVGLEAMRQDLNERVSTRSEGKVREFVIRTLVVQ